ncbi:ATP-binding cassette domain-containing protein [Methanobacterium petrolearium]|uniref:ATP-binding cassette domain-containing protein n=1 Tax=Methanobacterium petrolearium TaxID=710190 RepID=UPI001AE4D16D|nr:ATP-binding cassette domain-containing protein [Methanobacterium petrolearium]MBP1946032.1 cobalt/nickel transport system ATP-binding protein [Methanobacterium petrolearium]
MVRTIIQTENMSFTYPDGTSALHNINIEIKEGERVAIVGSNGAGKSTLFAHFNGINQPTSGLIKIDGQSAVYEKKELLQIRQKVGIVFQNPDDQLFAPTVVEDVAFGPMNLGLSEDEVDERVEEALKMVGMTGLEKRAPHHLSGGQKKRVAIAGILAMRPEIMVLDEPTTGLDPKGVDQVMEILYKLNQEDMSIIIASHDVEMVTQFADKIFVLHDGEIIGQGTPEEIFNNYETLKKAHLRPPKSAELLHLLKNNGVECEVKLTVEEAYHEILHAIGAESFHKVLHLVKSQLHHRLLHELGEENYHKMLHVLEEEHENHNLRN